jgi:hypothetical protein
MIRDENGKLSSTRVVLMIMVAMFCFIVISGTTVDAMVYTILNAVILLCLGGTSVRGTVKCMGDRNGSS